jgi:hypothetical protein
VYRASNREAARPPSMRRDAGGDRDHGTEWWVANQEAAQPPSMWRRGGNGGPSAAIGRLGRSRGLPSLAPSAASRLRWEREQGEGAEFLSLMNCACRCRWREREAEAEDEKGGDVKQRRVERTGTIPRELESS